MSSLKKRATWGMVISMGFLVAGIALLCFGHDSLDQAFKTAFADIEKSSEEDLATRILVGSLPFLAGGGLTILGLVLFPVFLATWVRNPPPGSKLTIRGWKTPEERTKSDLARDEAWRAILWGYLASQTWILQFFLGGYHALILRTPLTLKILVLLVIMCIAFYALGIRLCRRRDPASVAAAPWSWKLALAVNYGGLLVFLSFIGTLFILRSRA